jgi:hypothetical protein
MTYHSKEKKMSRTPGAKDKKPRKTAVKKIMTLNAEVNPAEKVKARKPRTLRLPKIDWEKLAKQLQQALAAEIKENDELRSKNAELMTQGIKLLGAIEYLELKRGNN